YANRRDLHARMGRDAKRVAASVTRRGGKDGVHHGQNEDRQKSRREQAANDDGRERSLDLAPRCGRQGHWEEAERCDERGHEHRPQPQLGRAEDRLTVGNALLIFIWAALPPLELSGERDENEAVEDGDAEERDEADPGRDRKWQIANEERDDSSD